MLEPVVPAPQMHWGAESLWEDLVQLLPELSVEVVASIGSTNSALLDRARAQAAAQDNSGVQVRRSVESSAFGRRAMDWQPCLLVAEHQTAGRGRMGREWHATPVSSLTFSLAIPLAPRDWSGLSLAVGVALADALQPQGDAAQGDGLRVGLKWPNDLWLMDADGGRKLGGILIETVATGPKRLAVVGVGLNVQALSHLRASDTSTGLASVQELWPEASPPQVLARVARPLVEALQRFEREGFGSFVPAFEQRDLLRGRAVRTTQGDAPEGVAAGVAPDGSLWVDTPQGRVAISSGEVSVRLNRGDAA